MREGSPLPYEFAEIVRHGGKGIVGFSQTSVGTDVHGGPFRLVYAVRGLHGRGDVVLQGRGDSRIARSVYADLYGSAPSTTRKREV